MLKILFWMLFPVQEITFKDCHNRCCLNTVLTPYQQKLRLSRNRRDVQAQRLQKAWLTSLCLLSAVSTLCNLWNRTSEWNFPIARPPLPAGACDVFMNSCDAHMLGVFWQACLNFWIFFNLHSGNTSVKPAAVMYLPGESVATETDISKYERFVMLKVCMRGFV